MSDPVEQTDRGSILASQIRTKREALGLTRSELAARAGVADTYIKDLESGSHARFGPGLFAVMDIAAALGCGIDELAGGAAPDFDGLAVIDTDRVRIACDAQSIEDFEPLRWPSMYLLGIYLDRGCRIVPASELTDALNRLRENKDRLEAKEEGKKREGRKRR